MYLPARGSEGLRLDALWVGRGEDSDGCFLHRQCFRVLRNCLRSL